MTKKHKKAAYSTYDLSYIIWRNLDYFKKYEKKRKKRTIT